MKKLIILISIFLLNKIILAQLVNINPNPEGEPWWVFETSPITLEIQSKIDQVPLLSVSDTSHSTSLPLVVDNSEKKYMRSVFNQRDGCCAQASGIGYTYTYEINRLRNLSLIIKK